MPKNLRLKLDEVFEIQSTDSLLIETDSGTKRVDFGDLIFDLESFDVKGQIISNTSQLTSLSAQLETSYTESLSTVNEFDILASYYKTASGCGDIIGGAGTGTSNIEMNHTHVLNFDLVDGNSNVGDVSPGLGGTTTVPVSALRLTTGIYKVECQACFSLVEAADYVVYGEFPTGEEDVGYSWEELTPQTGYITLELFKTTAPSQVLLISNPSITPGKTESLDSAGGYGMSTQECFMYGYIVICGESEVILRANWAGGFNIGTPNISNISDTYSKPSDSAYPIQLIFQKISDNINAFNVNPFLPPS